MKMKLLLTATFAVLLAGCAPEKTTTVETPSPAVQEAKEEAEKARANLNRRLDQLDAEVDRLEAKAKKASAKTKAKLNEEAREMRVQAKNLRARMSTWDDKVESAWKTAKREVEEGLDKAESSVKKFVDDIKD